MKFIVEYLNYPNSSAYTQEIYDCQKYIPETTSGGVLYIKRKNDPLVPPENYMVLSPTRQWKITWKSD